MQCSFGCGREASYLVSGQKPCCSKYESECPKMVEEFKKLSDREQIEKDGLEINILNVAGFRSNPEVNNQNDMVQVTATMSKITFKRLQQFLNIQYNEN